MGLRRRLSKKWNETVNGVLSGPGVDVDSVNTDDATIGGQPSDYHYELLQKSEFASETIDITVDTSSYANDADILVDVALFGDTQDEGLQMRIGGHTAADYDYTQRDRDGFTTTDGDTSFELTGPTGSDPVVGMWHISAPGGGRVQVFGNGRSRRPPQLISGQIDSFSPVPESVRIFGGTDKYDGSIRVFARER